MRRIAVLKQIMHRLTDAYVSFDAANDHLFSATFAQGSHECVHTAATEAVLVELLMIAQTCGNFRDTLSQALRILLSQENWNLENFACFNQYDDIPT
jgi:hypothetical protein